MVYLFWKLIEASPTDLPKRISLNIAEEHLKRDVFLYVQGVSCSYHEDIHSCTCAGGTASRLGFIICDFCCQLYAIPPIEGCHVPNGINVSDLDPTFDSSFSSMTMKRTPKLRLELESVPQSSDRFKKSHILSAFIRKTGPETFELKPDDEIRSGEKLADLPAAVLSQLNVEELTEDDRTYYSFDTTLVNAPRPPLYAESDASNLSFVSALEAIPK